MKYEAYDQAIGATIADYESVSTSHPSPQSSQLTFSIEQVRSTNATITISAGPEIITQLLHESALSIQKSAHAPGFNRGEVPIEYIAKTYCENLMGHVTEFLFKFCVTNFLYKKLHEQQIPIAGDPRLINITQDGQTINYIFEVSLYSDLIIHEWKYFPFKSPKRKNYKDLDRQVEGFIAEETMLAQNYNGTIGLGDWVLFSLRLISASHNESEIIAPEQFWFKIGADESENTIRDLFIGRKESDTFVTQDMGLQSFFGNQLETNYLFEITIDMVIVHHFFCFEQFKKYFRIKTNKDLHRRLIEVFSYRNDISQRRSIVEESLKLLLSRHKFTPPTHLVLRQQKTILDIIQDNPDYGVYKMQKDFNQRIRQLAEKQAKEILLIDRIAQQDNITLNEQDIRGYLSLTMRPRTKEFIYFQLPSFKVQGQEVPICVQEIHRCCLREKTINHIIYYLTKS